VDAACLFSLLIGTLRNSTAMLLDASGVIEWCCPRCLGPFGLRSAEQLVGQRLGSVSPEAWAGERTDAVAQALAEERVVTLVGIVDGRRVVTRCVPLKAGGSGARRALMIIEPCEPGELSEYESGAAGPVVWSRVHDLGDLDCLTSRELEVLALLGRGMRTKEIAQTLHRSVSTIDGHRERIGQKLGINDRAELISIARRAGLRVEDADGARVRLRPPPPRRTSA
jgi:DNA-binding CsgD family transcriptional regulator